MGQIRRVKSRYCDYLAGIIRDQRSTPEQLRKALGELGAELGRHVLASHYLQPSVVTTPVNDQIEVLTLSSDTTLVVTTKSDLESFGSAAAEVLSPARLGYMNFEGRRGLQALNSPIREMEIPDLGARVKTLVVAKSTLATGCTAISLTQTALEETTPDRLIIITVFHSLEGLQELQEAFPDAIVYCIGEPDTIDSNGMLHPGIGLLDERVEG